MIEGVLIYTIYLNFEVQLIMLNVRRSALVDACTKGRLGIVLMLPDRREEQISMRRIGCSTTRLLKALPRMLHKGRIGLNMPNSLLLVLLCLRDTKRSLLYC